MLKEPGTITVKTGSMRSGKSGELIEDINAHKRAKMKVLVVKPAQDTRDGDQIIAKEVIDGKPTNIKLPVDANFVSSRRDIMRLIKKTHCEVFAADEVQFFGRWFIKLVQELALERKMFVLLAGLDWMLGASRLA